MGETTNRMCCIICGKPVSQERLYCEEHRAYADADDRILQEAPMELLFPLIAGIFMRARADYELNVDGKKSDAEAFFRSGWAQSLSLSGFDPDKALKAMDEEVADGLDWFRTDSFKDKW